ncbi:PDZ domain-containing protein [Acidicapsa dinghuensis]|uniref:PDZ domain-containing protein n=1 Tax=Acidicapsa dinghuensis TaxID=2218256 RepID=A0ABW1EFK0_9BACT|nr:PDZ domain-containing protein [Acidicapsa dinghuensis]
MKYFLRPFVYISRKQWTRSVALLAAAGVFLGLSARATAQGLIQVREERPWFLLLHSHSQGFLGVDLGDVDQERAQALHLKDNNHGAEITILDHDAPAGQAGLKLHDVIVEMNGQTIEGAEQLKTMLHTMSPGKKLQLVINRDGAEQKVTVQLADKRKVQEEARERLGTFGASESVGSGFVAGGGAGDIPSGFHMPFGSSLHVGAMVEPLTAQMADFLGVQNGVMIKSVAHKSSADAAGLRAHDVVLAIGGEQVATTSDWERLLRSSEGKPVQVEIFRDRMKQLVLLQVTGKKK